MSTIRVIVNCAHSEHQVVVKIQNNKLRRCFSIYKMGIIVNYSIVSTVYKVILNSSIFILNTVVHFFGVKNVFYIITY